MTATVDDAESMARIEERVLPAASEKTADELARQARDTLKRLDPSGAQRRARAAPDDADVEFYPDPNGDIRVDESGQVYLTTASGQTRTVTPYDYRMDEPAPEGREGNDQ